jgi:hypothetical protein
MQDNCCGNFICEVGEVDCSDCGPYTVSTPTCSSCKLPEGMMFDIETKTDLTLTRYDLVIFICV